MNSKILTTIDGIFPLRLYSSVYTVIIFIYQKFWLISKFESQRYQIISKSQFNFVLSIRTVRINQLRANICCCFYFSRPSFINRITEHSCDCDFCTSNSSQSIALVPQKRTLVIRRMCCSRHVRPPINTTAICCLFSLARFSFIFHCITLH